MSDLSFVNGSPWNKMELPMFQIQISFYHAYMRWPFWSPCFDFILKENYIITWRSDIIMFSIVPGHRSVLMLGKKSKLMHLTYRTCSYTSYVLMNRDAIMRQHLETIPPRRPECCFIKCGRARGYRWATFGIPISIYYAAAPSKCQGENWRSLSRRENL